MSMRTARCEHGRLWYRECWACRPWRATEGVPITPEMCRPPTDEEVREAWKAAWKANHDHLWATVGRQFREWLSA